MDKIRSLTVHVPITNKGVSDGDERGERAVACGLRLGSLAGSNLLGTRWPRAAGRFLLKRVLLVALGLVSEAVY